MPLCLTFFSRGLDDAVMRNHAHYCRLYGYAHKWIAADHIAYPGLRQSYRYSQILRHLRALDEGDWLFFIDDDSVLFHPVAIDSLMDQRDLLVVEGPVHDIHPGQPMTNMMVLRNTAAHRQLVHALIADIGLELALVKRGSEGAALLRAVGVQPCSAVLHDVHVNISWRQMNWFKAPVFCVNLAPLPMVGPDGEPRVDALHDMNLQKFLVKQVNGALINGDAVLEPANYPALSADAETHINPGASIGFVTLYGHDIHSYARVSEHNVRRYCERHGYGYHVYRGLPPDMEQGINGTWAKTWVLQKHFSQHQWVIWVDADVLFMTPAHPVERLLAGRDLLLGKDVCAWPVNAGVLGFRHTEQNAQLLAKIWARIIEVQDKSGVYASQGDQFYINEVLREHGLTGDDNVYDNQTINTPPMLADGDSYLVHFVNLGEPYRSAFMADMDAASQRTG